MHRSLYDALCQAASEHPNQVAWIIPSVRSIQTIAWSEFRQHVDRLARWLASSGITRSDRVVNLEPNSHRWAMLDLACAALGAIHSPIDPRWHTNQIKKAIDSLEPKAIFTTRDLGLGCKKTKTIEQALEQATIAACETQVRGWQDADLAEQTANILWTSGTSASPKGVMLSHCNLLTNAYAKLDAMPQQSTDVRLNILPFAHAYARTCELTTWLLSKSAMACAVSSHTFSDTAQGIQPTLINAVPSLFEYWIKAADQVSTEARSNLLRSFFGGQVRQLASGGAAIGDSIRQRLAQESLPIFQGYGLTEASPVVCSNRAAPAVLDGVGPPVQGVELRVDSNQRLWVRSPGLMQGYWRNEAATSERIQNGWLDTGDCVAFGTNATNLYVTGRADDIQVLSTGYKFSPRMLEQPIEQIDGIVACVVLGTNRRRPIAIVCSQERSDLLSQSQLLEIIHSRLIEQPEHLKISQVVVCTEAWTVENGLRHWKGGVNRKEIARRFAPD
ncbi:MAG: AMP-binding protein [Pirellula sp.]